jgi:acyl-coenzyme A thioesterase PaaI-like protein
MEVTTLDYEALRKGFEAAIPYNRYLGLEAGEVGEGRGVITLPDDDRLHNHVASQHAGALFSAGEAASGAAFMGAFADHLANVTPLARSADISYLKLAKGPITATGTLGEGKDALLSRLDAEGKVEFPVVVELTDAQGTKVAEMMVHWHVRRNDRSD